MTQRDQIIRRMHRRGATMTDIGLELGVSRQRVAQLADRLGLEWAKKPSAQVRQRKLPALLRQGLPDREIAQRLGVGEDIIGRDVRAMRGTKQLRKQQRQARPGGKRRDKIPALIEKGLSAPAIGKRLGVATSTIYRDLTLLKLPGRLHRKRLDNGRAMRIRALVEAARKRSEKS